MPLNQNDLEKLEEKLLEEKKRTEEELSRIATPTKAPGDYVTKFDEIGEGEDENASEIEEYADNLAVESSLESQLKDILASLEKIKVGTYGKCENCGKEIPLERLLAYPAAKTCGKC